MIRFIQKYQWYFYVVITTMIVISFSFFGTYGSLQNSGSFDQTAFTTVNGENISRGELEQMAYFISSDGLDKMMAGPQPGYNFLNDGVIRKNFLETGLGVELIGAFAADLKKDLDAKMVREKSYKPYQNQKAPFISSEMAWSYFAPSIKQDLEFLKLSVNPLDQSALQARVNLYLAEKQFPAHMLSRVLRYQENQYGWLEPDPFLNQADLSLFGYHTIDDWFGPRFTRLVSEFIYNAAAIAESKGYKVSSEEAYADLARNAEKSFQELKSQKMMPFATSQAYMNDQIRRMGLEPKKVVKIWQKVLLFRRLFDDVANIQIVDAKISEPFFKYADQMVEGNLYRLPDSLRFNEFKDLYFFETYLAMTAGKKAGDLTLPKTAKTVDQLKQDAPELLQKRYLVEVKQASEKGLEGRITLKDTLAWQTAHYDDLQKEFPDLGIKPASTLEAKIDALDQLDDKMRAKVDQFSRSKIVAEHPEWMKNSLELAEPQVKLITVAMKGGKDPLPGITNRDEFMQKLDKSDMIDSYTQDSKYVYSIKVLDRSSGFEVMNYNEAESLMPELTKKVLEPYYVKNREGKDNFKTDKGFKPYDEVQNDVAALYYEATLSAIKEKVKASLKDKAPQNMIPDIAASYRFYNSAEELQKNPAVVKSEEVKEVEGKLPARPTYQDQFGWKKEPVKLTRSEKSELFQKELLFKLKPNEWSQILTPPNGDIALFQLVQLGQVEQEQQKFDETFELSRALGNEANRNQLKAMIPFLKEKNAINFSYLEQEVEEMEPPPPMVDDV